MSKKGGGKVELTGLEKCECVRAAVNGRRPITVTEALKKYALNPAIY
jgi:hypothetical protein